MQPDHTPHIAERPQPVAALCRRILLFPGGNNVTQLSVYLDVADSATLPQGWSRQAHFTLTVHNQKDPSRSVIKGTRQLPLSAALRLLPTALPSGGGVDSTLLSSRILRRCGSPLHHPRLRLGFPRVRPAQ